MSRAGHRGKGAASRCRVWRAFREWTDPLASGKRQRGLAGVFIRRHRGRDVIRFDSGEAQIRVDPPAAITPSRHCSRPHFGELTIIDIAEIGHLPDQFLDGWGGVPAPAAIAQLALQIAGQLCPRRGIALHIPKREPPQRVALERRNVAI